MPRSFYMICLATSFLLAFCGGLVGKTEDPISGGFFVLMSFLLGLPSASVVKMMRPGREGTGREGT